VPYTYVAERAGDQTNRLGVFRVNSTGVYDNILVQEWRTPITDELAIPVHLITNADTGVLLSWCNQAGRRMAITTGTAVTVLDGPQLPGEKRPIVPVLQSQDGSFIGTVATGGDETVTHMVAFEATGAVLWTVAGNWQPQIATVGNGVVASREGGADVMFDHHGFAIGPLDGLPTYSWKGTYQLGSTQAIVPFIDLAVYIASSHVAVKGGNLTGNGFSLLHKTFGLFFCGPEGDGTCIPPNNIVGTPVVFSYLPLHALNAQTYTQAANFGSVHSDWVQTVKLKAHQQYRDAFAHLPAIVRRKESLQSINNSEASIRFDHTTYINGFWGGLEVSGYTPYYSCSAKGICRFSWVYYLTIMGNAQQALGYLTGGQVPVSPPYPPETPSAVAQFKQIMTAIGHALGAVAVHETAHQLNLPNLDCDKPYTPCPEQYLYENYASGSNHEWFYGSLPGKCIHWSPAAVCALESYLLRWQQGCR
jgi:hypothetical protein